MLALVVDDSRAIRRITREILEALDVTVLEAADGRAALDVLSESPGVDLVVLDLHMPVMNGLELAREVRARDELRGVRLLMVTSECTREQMVEALGLGIDEYLTKPFTAEMLVQKLALLGVEAEAR